MQSPPEPPPPPPQPQPPQPHQSHQNYQPYQQQHIVENGGHTPGRPESTELAFVLNVTHNLTQLCLGGVIYSALIIANISTLSETLAQHIILCTTGYFILMTQAILSFSPYGFASSLKYENKKIIHFSMQILGSVLAITGSIIRIADNGFNFDSGHGICGSIAMLLAVCSLLGGALSLIFPKQTNGKLMKILHSCVGIATLCLAFISLVLAFHYYYRLMLGDCNANISIVLTMFALFGTVLMSMVRNVRRILNK